MQTSTQTNRRWKTPLLAGMLTLLATGASIAQQMNYQGRLTDGAGNAVSDAQYSITFDIYDAATDGTKQWGPQVIPADTVQGRFNVILGPTDTASRNIINAFNGGTTRYLQITFQGNAILPRQQILAAPVALRALISDTVTNGSIGTAQLADGSVTAAKISGGTGVWLTSPSGTDIYRGAGNVGIGNTNPAAKLDVTGNANITGTLQVQNFGTTTGNIHVGAYSSGGTPKLINFGDSDYVHVGENGADDTLELKGSTISMVGSVTANGSITAGGNITANGKGVVVGEETNLRIVRGTVAGASGTAFGTGFTSSRLGSGSFRITFSAPFLSAPTVTATCSYGNGTSVYANTRDNTATGFDVNVFDANGNTRDYTFDFIAIGPR